MPLEPTKRKGPLASFTKTVLIRERDREAIIFLDLQITKTWFDNFEFFIDLDSVQILQSGKRSCDHLIRHYKNTHIQLDLENKEAELRRTLISLLNEEKSRQENMLARFKMEQLTALDLTNHFLKSQDKDLFELLSQYTKYNDEEDLYKKRVLIKYARHFRALPLIKSDRDNHMTQVEPESNVKEIVTKKESSGKIKCKGTYVQVWTRRVLNPIDFDHYELELTQERKNSSQWQDDLNFLKTFMQSQTEVNHLDQLVANNVDPVVITRLLNSGYDEKEIEVQIATHLKTQLEKWHLYEQLLKLCREYFLWASTCKTIQWRRYYPKFVRVLEENK